MNRSTDFEIFENRIENLPGNWRAVDYSRGFNGILISMDNMLEIADFILLMSMIAILLLVSLTVLLFLYDRKHEIGVYLALGEYKKRIIWQILVELTSITIVAMTLALFVGNILASNLSHEMLRYDLANPSLNNRIDEIHLLEELGYRFELTHEEMLEAYEVSLDFKTVLYFYVIGLGMVSLSTIVPIIRIVSLNPKKVLI